MKPRAPWIVVLAAVIAGTLAGAVPGYVVHAQTAPPAVAEPAAGLGLAAPYDPRAPSHVIFPTQSLPLRFDHARHLGLGGVTCERCHADVLTSVRAGDRRVPAEATCTPCHAVDRALPLKAVAPGQPVARCDGCHVGWEARSPQAVARVVIPPANLQFSHRAHLARGQTCAGCHGDFRAVGLATRLELPRMSSCLGCHRGGVAQGGARDACATCHLTDGAGTLRTRFPEGWLNPPEWMQGLHHNADFWVTHRYVAARDASRCAACHREDDCVACHDGTVPDARTHPNDYATQHPIDARMNADRCGSCHRVATFCVACHLRVGVAETSPSALRAPGRFHPPASVWVSAPVTAQHHGAEARRSLTTCVSCHTEQDCVACHASLGRGAGFSPHPPGFARRCGTLLHASDRPCRMCHNDMASIETQCR